ncbi:hypothetical protein JBE04_02135 [Streptomyces sp. PRKS01-29]|nr:hypothetical protein [Streptomyces sabulosicollis]
MAFEQAVGAASRLEQEGRKRRARAEAERAVEMWRGEPLVDARPQQFAEREAARLQELRLCAEDLRAALLLRAVPCKPSCRRRRSSRGSRCAMPRGCR